MNVKSAEKYLKFIRGSAKRVKILIALFAEQKNPSKGLALSVVMEIRTLLWAITRPVHAAADTVAVLAEHN